MTVVEAPTQREVTFTLDPLIDAPLVGPRVLSFVGPLSMGCNIWRVWQPAATLKLHGYPAEWGWFRDARNAPFLLEAEALVFCRSCWPRQAWRSTRKWLERAHQRGQRAWYEYDDDMFTPFSVDHLTRRPTVPGGRPPLTEAEVREEIACGQWTLAHADGVTVSTQYLASIVRRFTAAPVEVVPNAIDHEWFLAKQRGVPRPIPGLTIGWAGGNRPDSDLAMMAEAWGRIARRSPDVTFIVAGTDPPVIRQHVPEARIHRVPWLDAGDYPRGMVGIDIGCCPLEDHPFNRAKTPIKAWEYALSGAAVVASPTVYGQVIDDLVNGYLARTVDEWEACLRLLLEWHDHRADMARRLRRQVRERWSLRVNYWRWPAAWNRLMETSCAA